MMSSNSNVTYINKHGRVKKPFNWGFATAVSGVVALTAVATTLNVMTFNWGAQDKRELPVGIQDKVENRHELSEADYTRLKKNDAIRTCELLLRSQFRVGVEKPAAVVAAEKGANESCVQQYLAAPVELNGQG